MGAVPLYIALDAERNRSQYGSHQYHGMQTDETAFEEVLHRECLSPTVVIRIADNESRQDKEKVHRQITVIDGFYHGSAGKSIAFEHVIP